MILFDWRDRLVGDRAAAQLAGHERVCEATRVKGRVTVRPVLPICILGAGVLLLVALS